MLGHNAVADTKPQAGATLFPSGGEKGVKNFIKLVGWNAGTIIAERNPDIAFYLLSLDAELPSTICLSYYLLGN